MHSQEFKEIAQAADEFGMVVRGVHMSPSAGDFVAALQTEQPDPLRYAIFIGRMRGEDDGLHVDWEEDDWYDTAEELDRWFAARITGVLTEKVSAHG